MAGVCHAERTQLSLCLGYETASYPWASILKDDTSSTGTGICDVVFLNMRRAGQAGEMFLNSPAPVSRKGEDRCTQRTREGRAGVRSGPAEPLFQGSGSMAGAAILREGQLSLSTWL